MKLRWVSFLVTLGVAGSIAVGGCGSCDSAPGTTYFDRVVEPVLKQHCAGNTSGCHAVDPMGDPSQIVFGNLDVTSFASISKRRDVLTRFGAYPYPLLLIKAVAPLTLDPNPADATMKLQMPYGNGFIPIDVFHGGGSIFAVDSDGFNTLQTWLENGATEDGLKPATPAQTGNGACSTLIPPNPDGSMFDPTAAQADPNFGAFKSGVQPILTNFGTHGCASSNCHGAQQSDFYVTCGNDDTQIAFNFSQASKFVAPTVSDSSLLRVPLAVSAGGRGHTGGDQFPSTTDGDYVTLLNWATSVAGSQPAFGTGDPGRTFFATYVQPVLLQRGCEFQACHSPQAFNDFKLRSGTQGFFSSISLEKNYQLLKNNFMALEYPDVRRGRAVAKTILFDDARISDNDPTQVGGIAHRAGSVLETPNCPACSAPLQRPVADPATCPAFNPAAPTPSADTPVFCLMQDWLEVERAALGAGVAAMDPTDTSVSIVYVSRPGGSKLGRLEYDQNEGGSDLLAQPVSFADAFGQGMVKAGAPVSLLTNCAGLTAGTADVHSPDVKNDGDTVVFAARKGPNQPLSVYTVVISTGVCTQFTPDEPAVGGLNVDNFDPAWSPDGLSVVYASTRGKTGVGPSLSRTRLAAGGPQSDIWRQDLGSPMPAPVQMTFLSNSEISPHFMREGRMTMTTEKASSGFYQLSGRRMNWDMTDYHPLLAQRASSSYADLTDLTKTLPSIGYGAATDIREGNDGSFTIILSDADGALGALATFNRSIGPFSLGRNDPGYLPSVKFLGDPAATGRAGVSTGYRAPFYLPTGEIMVSYTTDGGATWDIVAVNPRRDPTTDPNYYRVLVNGGVDAVLAYKYPAREMYSNRRQLVFGNGTVDPMDNTHATLHMPDAPMVFTLLTGNLRLGRPVDAFRKATQLAVYSEGMCPPGTSCTANTMGIYQMRTLLGTAPLASDGSVLVKLPAQTGVVLELQDSSGAPVVTMGEEHQLGPGEHMSMGVQQTNAQGDRLFDSVCAGCHGSVSGSELDVNVTPDALTTASESASMANSPQSIGN